MGLGVSHYRHGMSKKLSLAFHLTPILPNGLVLPLSRREARRAEPRPLKTAGVPFFRDPAHTIPTRGLYRHLLRLAGPRVHGTSVILSGAFLERSKNEKGEGKGGVARWALRRDWRTHRHLTSIPSTRSFLETQLDLLSRLSSSELASRDTAIRELEAAAAQYHRQDAVRVKRAEKPAPPRSRLTGGFLRPTLFNPPLPRLKPQLESISMMIHHRLRARENRQAKAKIWQDWSRDMKAEMAFYRNVYSPSAPPLSTASSISRSTRDGDFPRDVRGTRKAREIRKVQITGPDADFIGGWDDEFNRMWDMFQEQFGRDVKRSESKFSQELVDRVEAARKRRDESKRQRAERRKVKTGSLSEDKASTPEEKPPTGEAAI